MLNPELIRVLPPTNGSTPQFIQILHSNFRLQITQGQLLSILLFPVVTGSRDRLTCMPVDQGKSWEPAHTPWISSYLILSHLDLISSSVFTVVSLIKGCCPLCTSSALHLVSCLAIVVCSRTFCYYSYLLPSLVTQTC